jgi:hypothetical protein
MTEASQSILAQNFTGITRAKKNEKRSRSDPPYLMHIRRPVIKIGFLRAPKSTDFLASPEGFERKTFRK